MDNILTKKYMPKYISMSRLLFLDTKHSISPNSPSDTEFVLNSDLAGTIGHSRLSLQSVGFPNSSFNINQYNNKIYFYQNPELFQSPLREATITPNNYTIALFATEIQTQMNAVMPEPNTYTVSFDEQTLRLTITNNFIAQTTQITDGPNSAGYSMGFLGAGGESTQASDPLVASHPVRLDGSLYVDVQTNIGTLNYSSNGKTNLLARIPLTAPYGTIQYYENQTDDFLQLVADDIYNLEIRLLDDKGRLFELPSNSEVFFVFLISS